ncbi:MAG: YidC/Oxa1 family membrane protein insertase [Patescibacteria group bacterium]
MFQIFTTIFYQPLFNLLVWLYNLTGSNIAIAIILLTVIIKLVLYPFSKQSLKSQKALQDIQPKINELKTKYKDDKEKMTKEMMALYKQEKVNPFSSCLPLLIQLPFLFAVFQVFRKGLNSDGFNLLYPFVANPGHIDPFIFSYDLSHPIWIFGVLAGAAQYWQTKMLMHKKAAIKSEGAKDENMAAAMNKQMLYFMPVLTVVFGFSLPGGLMLYWFINTVLTIAQQYLMFGGKKEVINPSNAPTN